MSSEEDPGASSALRNHIALLTGGDDRSYAIALTLALAKRGVIVDFIGSDKLDGPELHQNGSIRFINLRGDQSETAGRGAKVSRLLRYYARLVIYSLRAKPITFHILWNNKFEYFDRTFLTLFYRACGRRVVLTAHNVNAAKRDGRDSLANRVTLKIQYLLSSHIFVHSNLMKDELTNDFGVASERISVIPFGVNDTSPRTDLTAAEAREKLGLGSEELVLLFFGQIAPYKGLEHLIEALPGIIASEPNARLIVAGKVKRGSESYWRRVQEKIHQTGVHRYTILRIQHIPDCDVEVYFKAADALVVPYVNIYQSGVPFLAYSFGLPVIATDVGALAEDVIEGETGFICKRADAQDLTRAVVGFARSSLRRESEQRRRRIAEHVQTRHSWDTVGHLCASVYRTVSGERVD